MLTLRYMTMQDIPQVLQIDRQSFQLTWTAKSYAYEIAESNYSHMLVLEERDDLPEAAPRWWKRFVPAVNGRRNGRHPYTILGYGGLWQIVDESHISTIAVHPAYRGQGYGEVLLAGMIERARTLASAYVVLEVRVSNIPAQGLYLKYDFEIYGTKADYYHDNQEDAYDMRLYFDENTHARFEQRFRKLQKRLPFDDQFTHIPMPRT